MDNNENELTCGPFTRPVWEDLDVQAVWLTEYRTYGILLREGAHTATVQFKVDGETVTEEVENDEYTYWQDHAIEYERE